MKCIRNQQKITFIGEFADRQLEKKYFSLEISNATKNVKLILQVIGVLYFLGFAADYFLIKDLNRLPFLFLDRIAFLGMLMVLYVKIKHFKNYYLLVLWISIHELIGSILFLFTFYQYRSPNFLIQSAGVMIIILFIFLVPNRWINVLVVSLLISIGFLVISVHYYKGLNLFEFLTATLYITLVIILCSITSLRSNFYKRKQYLYDMDLIRIANTDALTGICNRMKFNKELEYWIHYSQKHGLDLSLVMFDFDNFKRVNDVHGHLVGDKVMVEIVKIIQEIIREVDVFARWGGEEFVILLPKTNKEGAVRLAERLKIEVAEHVFNTVGQITCSFGIAMLNENDDAESFIQRADQKLYLAKQAGKNTFMT